MNLSCNFFKGEFDMRQYLSFVDDYFKDIAILEKKQDISKEIKKSI